MITLRDCHPLLPPLLAGVLMLGVEGGATRDARGVASVGVGALADDSRKESSGGVVSTCGGAEAGTPAAGVRGRSDSLRKNFIFRTSSSMAKERIDKTQ